MSCEKALGLILLVCRTRGRVFREMELLSVACAKRRANKGDETMKQYFTIIFALSFATIFLASCGSESPDLSDCDPSKDRNDYGLTWVPIPGGSFMMGCVPQDSDCRDEEKPRHKVSLSAFEMTATQMTRKQECALPGASCDTNTTECEDCPVERVEGGQAEYVCETAGGHLPTEAQWEYVARAGTETIFACGDDRRCMDDKTTALYSPVGQHSPNAFGLYDIMSDYSEYCLDGWYDYTSDEENNPLHHSNEWWKILRTGGWRLSGRNVDGPASIQGEGITFRCVRKAACK